MRLAKDSGTIIILLTILLVFFTVGTILLWYFFNSLWFYIILLASVITYIFFLWFFRDPFREISTNTKHILAPADGKIMKLEESKEGIECLIRMSPFDVHITRSPIKGEVKSINFKKGSHWPAYFPNYAKRNQRNKITIQNDKLEVIVTQITGIFARRAVAFSKSGDEVMQGEKIGIIRFGSLTHLELISTDKKYKVVKPTPSITRAGKTILAEEVDNSD